MRGVVSTGRTAATAALLALALGAGAAGAQVPGTLQEFGAPVYPAYEGWYENPDGSITLLAGYFNANTAEIVDVPVGESNYIEPGPADQGQPTRFAPGRSWGVFTMRIPGDDPDRRVIWHVTANGETVSIPMHLDPQWIIEPFEDAANGNKPPVVRFAPAGEEFTGPPIGIGRELTATVGAPLELAVWTSDEKPTDNLVAASRRPRPALILRWHVVRGPGEVEFSAPVQEFADSSDQNPATTATFAAAGDYVLRVEALDETGVGGSGFQCCWTSALVAVRVSDQESAP